MKRIIFALVLILALISIVNSVNAIYTLLRKRDLLIAAQRALEQSQKMNQQLKKQLQTVNSKTFIEEEARNKLFFVKPKEETIFIARELISTSSAEAFKNPVISNWEQWLRLFFPS